MFYDQPQPALPMPELPTGVWVSFYPDLSGVVPFATAAAALNYAAAASSGWVLFLPYGVDLAELVDQVLDASRRRPAHHHEELPHA